MICCQNYTSFLADYRSTIEAFLKRTHYNSCQSPLKNVQSFFSCISMSICSVLFVIHGPLVSLNRGSPSVGIPKSVTGTRDDASRKHFYRSTVVYTGTYHCSLDCLQQTRVRVGRGRHWRVVTGHNRVRCKTIAIIN